MDSIEALRLTFDIQDAFDEIGKPQPPMTVAGERENSYVAIYDLEGIASNDAPLARIFDQDDKYVVETYEADTVNTLFVGTIREVKEAVIEEVISD